MYAFHASPFHRRPPSPLDEASGVVRLAWAVTVVLSVFAFRDSHAGSGTRPAHASALDVMLAYSAVYGCHLAAGVVAPALALPRWSPTEGGFVGITVLVATRSLFAPAIERKLEWRCLGLCTHAQCSQPQRWHVTARESTTTGFRS